MPKLNHGQIHIMKLLKRDCDKDGWTPIGDKLYPHIRQSIPPEFVIFKNDDSRWFGKLTEKGNNFIEFLNYI